MPTVHIRAQVPPEETACFLIRSAVAPAVTAFQLSVDGPISTKSPRSVQVSRIVPAGSSSMLCADKHADMRQGPTALRTFLMRFFRSR